MTEARDRSYKHSTPSAQLQEPERCRTWVFVCQCVRQLDSPQAHQPVCLCVLMHSTKWSTEYVGRTEDGHSTPRGSRLRAQLHQSPVNLVYSLLFLQSCV